MGEDKVCSKFVPQDKRPYVCRYDEIVEMTFNGVKGWYCDGSWYSTYEYAFNVRATSILGG